MPETNESSHKKYETRHFYSFTESQTTLFLLLLFRIPPTIDKKDRISETRFLKQKPRLKNDEVCVRRWTGILGSLGLHT